MKQIQENRRILKLWVIKLSKSVSGKALLGSLDVTELNRLSNTELLLVTALVKAAYSTAYEENHQENKLYKEVI